MKDLLCNQFQDTVGQCLVRHRSVLDVLSKLHESNARVQRAVSKAVTSCGCVRVAAEKQKVPADISLQEIRRHMDTHLVGALCDHCRDVLETEMGNHIFYLAALCNLFDLSLYDVLLKEQKKLSALGIFNFS
mgnify:CR=1 FL=1